MITIAFLYLLMVKLGSLDSARKFALFYKKIFANRFRLIRHVYKISW